MSPSLRELCPPACGNFVPAGWGDAGTGYGGAACPSSSGRWRTGTAAGGGSGRPKAARPGRFGPAQAGAKAPAQSRPLPQRPRTPEGVLGPRRPAIPGACPRPPRRLQYSFFWVSAVAATSLSLRQRVANRYFYRRAFAAVASAFRHAASRNSQAHIHFGF